jgi:alkanesulfonate monooxygenase SsuD/methylene tetrahydromethanopterin reductase-like flavin-dependent oxidoreductase (luciferase family)
VKVGFTLDFRNPTGRPWRELWEDNLWLMTEAEQMGFDMLLIQEHFFSPDGYGPSVPVFLSILADRTNVARLGSYIYILPVHNAAALAQETAVLDHLSGGRLDVMVGAGHNPEEYRAFGMSPKTRPSRMEEGLEVLKGAWTQHPFDFHGRYYDLEGLDVQPSPLQAPHPPLWVASSSVAAAERAGRHGASLAAATADTEMFDAYLAQLAAAGFDRADVDISKSWSFTVTDEDPASVWARNRDLYVERWSFYSRVRSAMGDAELEMSLEEKTSGEEYRQNEVIGEPAYILEMLTEAKETLPITTVIHSFAAGIPARTETYESVKRFASEVLPVIKSW